MDNFDKMLMLLLIILYLILLILFIVDTGGDRLIVSGDLSIVINVPEGVESVDWCEMFPEDRVCLRQCSSNTVWVKELMKELR